MKSCKSQSQIERDSLRQYVKPSIREILRSYLEIVATSALIYGWPIAIIFFVTHPEFLLDAILGLVAFLGIGMIFSTL